MEKVDDNDGGIALPRSIQLTLVRVTAHNSRRDAAPFSLLASVGKARDCRGFVLLFSKSWQHPRRCMGYSTASILVTMAHLVA